MRVCALEAGLHSKNSCDIGHMECNALYSSPYTDPVIKKGKNQ